MNVPYANFKRMHQAIESELRNALDEVYESQYFIQGKALSQFEDAYSSYCNTEYCVGTGNGLDALRLMLDSFGIGPGDEVIVPANTFIATALAVSYVGAKPVFVDSDPKTLLMDSSRIEEAITSSTKAIIIVHLYGKLADSAMPKDIAQKYGLFLFEDAAQAHGASNEYGIAGSLGDAAAFSFYPGKNLGAFGDGGAVTTNNEAIAQKLRALGNYGSIEKYVHEYKGVNSRLDDIQAAVLLTKLKHLDSWNAERKTIASKYYDNIENEYVRLPDWDESSVHHIFPVFCESRGDLQDYMQHRGIQTQIHYPTPIHQQKAYADLSLPEGSLPVTEQICRTELSLPLYPYMTDNEIEYVIKTLNDYAPRA